MRCKNSIKSIMLLMLTMTAASLLGQDSGIVKVQPTKTPPTLPVLYRHFLAYQLHLERRADALKQAGKNGEDFRTHFQMRLGFSNGEFEKLHTSALHLEKALQEKDAEARKIIKDAHAGIPKSPLPKGFVIPPPPPRLKELQAERDDAINSEIETLQKSLTPADKEKLETFLKKDFAPAVTVGTLPDHISQPSMLSRRVK
ncbi:hypothetical protein FTW19_21460 [Terriglobus albidus]|uniref:Periplasmic heavy metal sensor n=1 Tax=Terriglobus albidus TaxID=1592106 RepID=A0A5B9EE61_9BACT|nr:hypothetical protein [Terriglobus albidus]QEE30322.1 hypothetical protein FTW19_21460 [Terriglobus albidus]